MDPDLKKPVKQAVALSAVVAPEAEHVLTPIAHAAQEALSALKKYPSLHVVIAEAPVQVAALVGHPVHVDLSALI